MFTIKHKFPKDFEKYSERCQSYYIHNIMSYGLNFEPEPIFWKLSEDVQLSYIAEILSTKKYMIIRQNKLFYKKFENEFTINNDVLRIITNFNNYYWNMNNQTEVFLLFKVFFFGGSEIKGIDSIELASSSSLESKFIFSS